MRIVTVLSAALLLTACQGKKPESAEAAPVALLVAPEDVIDVRSDSLAAGPSITGSIQPDRRADLRAEVSAIVLQVARENGDAVRRGDLLIRLDETAFRESLASAESSTRAAAQAFDQAERHYQRITTLRKSGMASTQQLDDAEIRRNNAQSDLAGAKTREVQARQQLQRTEVRAPFDGIVSERKVSAGDTAQIGKELLKVIDPSSMRLEGLVSADRIGAVKSGQAVSFRVNGYADAVFAGKVRRVSPSANAVTRQVEVLVDLVGEKQPRLAGLYAEGQIATDNAAAIAIPPTSLVRNGDATSVWRINGDKLNKVSVKLGARDVRSGNFHITTGLAEGDRLIRFPGTSLIEGQAIELAKANAPGVVAGRKE